MDPQSGFFGRSRELEALVTACAGQIDDRPVMVVHGEAGVGKTRLVTELASTLRAQGATVFWGGSAEGGITRPYEPWIQSISELKEHVGAQSLADRVGEPARWLRPLLEDADWRPAESQASPAIARVRLAEALAALLDFEYRPLLVLDDMQWSTRESLALLTDLARIARSLTIVVVFRGRSLELGHPLSTCLADVARFRACDYMRLDGLSRAGAEDLLQARAGRALASDQIDALYEQTRGNAFYLSELGRYLRRDAELTLAAGPAMPLPESLRAAVGARVARLSAETRRVLQMASVFTPGFGFGDLAAITELDDDTLLDCVEQALGEELIVDIGRDRYDFSHALVRRALYEQMSRSRRVRLHHRLAETIERMHQHDSQSMAAELVRQFHASAALPGAERGAGYAPQAAERARSVGAPADAVELLRLGLDLADNDPEMRARLLGRLAVAEAESQDFAAASDDLDRAMGLLERTGAEPEQIAELVREVGEAAWVDPSSSYAIGPLIDRAVDALGGRRDLLWARLKLVDRPVRRLSFGAITTLEWAPLDTEVVQIIRAEGSEADYAMTLNGWMPTIGSQIRELIDRQQRWTDPTARMYALIAIVGYLVLLGPKPDRRLIERLSDAQITLSNEYGLVSHRSVALALRAAHAGAEGRFDEAAEGFDAARELLSAGPPAPSSAALVAFLDALTMSHVAADWPQIADDMWRIAQQPEQFAGWLNLGCAAFAAEAAARAGQREHARELVEMLLPAVLDADPSESTCLVGRPCRGWPEGPVPARMRPSAQPHDRCEQRCALREAPRRARVTAPRALIALRCSESPVAGPARCDGLGGAHPGLCLAHDDCAPKVKV